MSPHVKALQAVLGPPEAGTVSTDNLTLPETDS